MENVKNPNCWLSSYCKGNHCSEPGGCLILYKQNFLYDNAGISIDMRKPRQLVIDRDNSDLQAFKKLQEIQNNIESFVKDGSNLLIHSKIAGNGKTSWAIKLVQSYINKIWYTSALNCRVLFINVPMFLLELKANISDKSEYIKHIKENVYNCDLVIWDDIGTKSTTNFETENLLSIIDARINKQKANIFTSNLTDAEMTEALGGRLASRICHLGVNIEFFGGDKRHLGRKEN